VKKWASTLITYAMMQTAVAQNTYYDATSVTTLQGELPSDEKWEKIGCHDIPNVSTQNHTRFASSFGGLPYECQKIYLYWKLIQPSLQKAILDELHQRNEKIKTVAFYFDIDVPQFNLYKTRMKLAVRFEERGGWGMYTNKGITKEVDLPPISDDALLCLLEDETVGCTDFILDHLNQDSHVLIEKLAYHEDHKKFVMAVVENIVNEF
jgi:hypothetical protein